MMIGMNSSNSFKWTTAMIAGDRQSVIPGTRLELQCYGIRSFLDRIQEHRVSRFKEMIRSIPCRDRLIELDESAVLGSAPTTVT